MKLSALLRRLRWTSALAGASPPARTPGPLPPGLLLLQLDGLSQSELESSLGAGHMPFLASLLRDQGYRLHSHYAGLPATTPCFQGEFFYGVPQSVPAWSFREQATGQIGQFLDPQVVARREELLAKQAPGLLKGGSAFACLLAGGAAEVHFCTGKERWLNFHTQLPPLLRTALAIRYLARLPRVALAMLREATRALIQALDSPAQIREQLAFLPKRVAINVAVRRYLRAGIGADLVRGVPIIYGNFLDYDCHAHLAGPHSAFARQVLPGIDHTLRHLWDHAQRSGRRRYQVWIFSDHGQEPCRPFAPGGEGALEGLLQPHLKPQEKLLIADNGPVAHIYLSPRPDQERLQQLAQLLVKELGVPQILWSPTRGQGPLERRRGEKEARVCNQSGDCNLPEDRDRVLGLQHPFGVDSCQDLIHLSQHPESGDLIALGWSAEQSLSFASELGCHGGPGPHEARAFALLPDDAPLGPETPLRPVHLREAALRYLKEDPDNSQKPPDGSRELSESRIKT